MLRSGQLVRPGTHLIRVSSILALLVRQHRLVDLNRESKQASVSRKWLQLSPLAVAKPPFSFMSELGRDLR